MEIIYCHHAERKRNKNKPKELWQEDGITELGEKDAQIFAEMLKHSGKKLTAVYTSPFTRCKKTAEIINQFSNVPIIEEKRFNEYRSVNNETWIDCQTRGISAIEDIIEKHKNDDIILCVTSGVNIASFINWAFCNSIYTLAKLNSYTLQDIENHRKLIEKEDGDYLHGFLILDTKK